MIRLFLFIPVFLSNLNFSKAFLQRTTIITNLIWSRKPHHLFLFVNLSQKSKVYFPNCPSPSFSICYFFPIFWAFSSFSNFPHFSFQVSVFPPSPIQLFSAKIFVSTAKRCSSSQSVPGSSPVHPVPSRHIGLA